MVSKHAPEADEVNARVVVAAKDRPDRIYANHVQVRYTPMDMTLEFCEFDGVIDSGLKKRGDHSELEIPAKVRIVLSHEVFGKLSSVMARIVEKHGIEVEPEETPDEHKQ